MEVLRNKMLRTNIIWNITKACPWPCSFCCVGASYTNPERESYSRGLSNLREKGLELSLEMKLRILENLDSGSLEFDLSGGDPLLISENLEVLEAIAKKFGRDNNSVTTTGYCLTRIDQDRLTSAISLLEFTYDYPYENDPLRPVGYNLGNLRAVAEMNTENIETTAQTPLTTLNVSPQVIRDIYSNLMDARIDNLLLMEYSSSGRGSSQEHLRLNKEEYNEALRMYKDLERKYKIGPRINLQAPFLPFGRALFRSLNITSAGLLLSNPWAYDKSGKPLDYAILGDLKTQKLSEICGKTIVARFIKQLRANNFNGEQN